MPRGSKPGERRGGRQRGTPNKKTLIKDAVFLAAAADPNRSPLDFMLALMRDPQVPLDQRIEVAVAAAPFVHARPEPARKKEPDPLDPRDRLSETGDLKFESLRVKPSGDGGGANPLEFLLGAMGDPAASHRQRIKAAATAARYTHALAGGGEAPTVMVVEDKFGFKVDPEMARAERDDRVRESRLGEFKPRSAESLAAAAELEKIRKRRAERVALVKFPENYSVIDREADQKRLGALYSKRLSRKKFTPEEEAEEAHLAVRVLNPEAIRLKLIPIGGDFEMKWPMSRIAELEEQFVVGETPLTAAEQDELNDLRGRYPEIAADADRLDHRYRYFVRREEEKAKAKAKEGALHSLEELLAVKDKCEHLREYRKMATLKDLREGPHERIRVLETLRFDEILSREEARELEELHRLYPQRAEKIRKFVNRRLSAHQANRDYMRRTGSDPGPIQEDGWPRHRTPTGRMAGR